VIGEGERVSTSNRCAELTACFAFLAAQDMLTCVLLRSVQLLGEEVVSLVRLCGRKKRGSLGGTCFEAGDNNLKSSLYQYRTNQSSKAIGLLMARQLN